MTPAEIFNESKSSQLMVKDEHGVVRAGDTEALVPSRWAVPKSVHPDRVATIVAGAAILVTVLRHLDLDGMLVSERDILDGIIAGLRAGG